MVRMVQFGNMLYRQEPTKEELEQEELERQRQADRAAAFAAAQAAANPAPEVEAPPPPTAQERWTAQPASIRADAMALTDPRNGPVARTLAYGFVNLTNVLDEMIAEMPRAMADAGSSTPGLSSSSTWWCTSGGGGSADGRRSDSGAEPSGRAGLDSFFARLRTETQCRAPVQPFARPANMRWSRISRLGGWVVGLCPYNDR